ncbi:MAG: hypothetical protein HQK50_13255 [Oligoflexia bacterium]|nr:hypothetical protein [Oligoflexia bacterium]MBF0366534.1 hypothetical protein [Oligoflexia bacterium]
MLQTTLFLIITFTFLTFNNSYALAAYKNSTIKVEKELRSQATAVATPSTSFSPFVISIFDNKINVVSPKVETSEVQIIIINKTMVKLAAKIDTAITSNNNPLHFLLYPNSKNTLSYHWKSRSGKTEKLFFVPLAPALQEVELSFGKESYDVPSKE